MNKIPVDAAGNAHELLIQSVVDYAIYMLNPEGLVMSWNPGAQRIKGYTADEIIGRHFSCFYTPEDRAVGMPETALAIAAETGRFSTEAWRQRKDGTRFWALVVLDAIRVNGEIVGFAKITRDITEQHNAQRAALESERRFRLLVESVTDYAIFMLSPEGFVSNWNAGAERIKGYTPSEIVGQHFSCFYTPEDRAAGIPQEALTIATRDGRYEAEGWRCRKDGTRFWANAVIDAIWQDGRLVGFAKITRDLSERRETQLELEKSREQIFQLQKMEAVGQLTGGLAHDFNNLLGGISGSLDLLKKRIDDGRVDNLDRYLSIAQDATARAAALTHRLLAFARRQTLDPKAVDANRLIVGMTDLIRRTVGPAITIKTVFGSDLWPMLCDPNQLENAILNLCINARDAMRDGGRLTIETRNADYDERSASGREIQPGQFVTISISDTGTGMSPEISGRAFEPFFTTKPLGQGTGLGLSMVYGFTRQSGGYARIYSEVGLGTTLNLCLPRHRGETELMAEIDIRPFEGLPAGNGETVMVVDDEPTIRELAIEVLEDLGYTALEAGDGPAALEVLRSNQPIDLLISDVGLPGGMNGRQLADAARLDRPALKVLFITGYAENAIMGYGGLDPGMFILTKPFPLEALASRVQAILQPAPPERDLRTHN